MVRNKPYVQVCVCTTVKKIETPPPASFSTRDIGGFAARAREPATAVGGREQITSQKKVEEIKT